MGTTTTSTTWTPSKAELASILEDMRPVIDRLVERDRRRMAAGRQAIE